MFTEIFPIVDTHDVAGALRFYRDLLGADVAYRFPVDGEPEYVGLRLGSTNLGVGRRDRSGTGRNDRIKLWVYAEDCDLAVERLLAAGVRLHEAPADQPWGERMAIVLDPDGNLVIIASTKGGATQAN